MNTKDKITENPKFYAYDLENVENKYRYEPKLDPYYNETGYPESCEVRVNLPK